MDYTRIPNEDVDSQESIEKDEKSNGNRNKRKLRRQGVKISFDADLPASTQDDAPETVSLEEPSTPDLITLKPTENTPTVSDSKILTSAKSRRSLRQRVKTLSSLFQRRPLQRQVSFYGNNSDIRPFRVREPTLRSLRRRSSSKGDMDSIWQSPSFKPWVSPTFDEEKPTETVAEEEGEEVESGCSNWWESIVLSNFVDQDYVQSQIDSGQYLNWFSLKFASIDKEQEYQLRSLDKNVLWRQIFIITLIIAFLLYDFASYSIESLLSPSSIILLSVCFVYFITLCIYVFFFLSESGDPEISGTRALLYKLGHKTLFALFFVNVVLQIVQICVFAALFPSMSYFWKDFGIMGLIRCSIAVWYLILNSAVFFSKKILVAWTIPIAFVVWGYLSHMDTVSLVSQAVALCLIVLIFLRSSYVLELALRNRLDIAWRLQSEKKSLQKEIKQHGTILQNILPKDICIALMNSSASEDLYKDTSIMFVELIGFDDFTKLEAHKSIQEVIQLLGQVHSEFDDLVDLYKVEKIKSFGSIYMIGSGFPRRSITHAHTLCALSLDIIKKIELLSSQLGMDLKVRIGIASGPVVAGVIGIKKFFYDVYGDTVNLASRMLSHGVVSRVQVSESTYKLIRGDFEVEDRGEISVKGKGKMRTFLLKGTMYSYLPSQYDKPHEFDEMFKEEQANKIVAEFQKFAEMKFLLNFKEKELETKYHSFVNSSQQTNLQMLLVLIAALSASLLISDIMLVPKNMLYVATYRCTAIFTSLIAFLLSMKFTIDGKAVNILSAVLLGSFTTIETAISVFYDSSRDVPIFASTIVVLLMLSSTVVRISGYFLVNWIYNVAILLIVYFVLNMNNPLFDLFVYRYLQFYIICTIFGMFFSYFMELQSREMYLLEQFAYNQKEDLQNATKKTLTLLDNILPRHIVKELIENPNQTIAQNYSFVTVLSADIVGFTTFSATISPVQLVNYLNLIFSEFDQLAIKYNIEKIRTIGDAYIAVGGLQYQKDHTKATLQMALDMIEALETVNRENNLNLKIRIGVCCGPCVAGVVVTKKKLCYDVWSEVVSIATKLEGTSQPGRVHVTPEIYADQKSNFLLEDGGIVHIKGKEMQTYLLVREQTLLDKEI